MNVAAEVAYANKFIVGLDTFSAEPAKPEAALQIRREHLSQAQGPPTW